jgi:hypothetical protein
MFNMILIASFPATVRTALSATHEVALQILLWYLQSLPKNEPVPTLTFEVGVYEVPTYLLTFTYPLLLLCSQPPYIIYPLLALTKIVEHTQGIVCV